jgi:hypothetical protein
MSFGLRHNTDHETEGVFVGAGRFRIGGQPGIRFGT